jgi:HlyD family secretion protein
MKVLRPILTILLIAGIAAGGYYGYQRYQSTQAAAKKSSYETVALTRGDLIGTVSGTGTVRSNQTAVLTWQTSGAVAEVKASLDETVRDGDTLASLDKTSLSQSMILAEADLITAQRNLYNLQPTDLAVAQAEMAVNNAEKVLKDAQKSRSYLNNNATKEQIDAAYATYLQAIDEVDHMQQAYDRVKDRPVDDTQRAIAESNLSSAIGRQNQAKANYDALLGNASAEDIARADAKVTLAEAQLTDARHQYEKLKNGPDQEDVKTAEARIAAIQATLNLQSLKAPFNGTITDVKIKPGDQVNPGTTAFRIDDLTRLLVDVQISEIDVNRITVAQTASISFDAIQGKNYTGKITHVARVGTVIAGAVTYTVTIELLDADENVRPAMTAAVNVIVNQLNDVLLVPNRAVRLRDGQRVVYLDLNGELVMTSITLGITSDTMSEVIAGDVQAGDLVVLNPPSDTSASGPPFMGGGFGR